MVVRPQQYVQLCIILQDLWWCFPESINFIRYTFWLLASFMKAAFPNDKILNTGLVKKSIIGLFSTTQYFILLPAWISFAALQ
jgi:hypothetical protein